MKIEYRKACECGDATATMPGITLPTGAIGWVIRYFPGPVCDVCHTAWKVVVQAEEQPVRSDDLF